MWRSNQIGFRVFTFFSLFLRFVSNSTKMECSKSSWDGLRNLKDSKPYLGQKKETWRDVLKNISWDAVCPAGQWQLSCVLLLFITLFTICRAMCAHVIEQEPLMNTRMAAVTAEGTAQFVHKGSGSSIRVEVRFSWLGPSQSTSIMLCVSAFVCVVVVSTLLCIFLLYTHTQTLWKEPCILHSIFCVCIAYNI